MELSKTIQKKIALRHLGNLKSASKIKVDVVEDFTVRIQWYQHHTQTRLPIEKYDQLVAIQYQSFLEREEE